jgi:hypothetical protein
MPNISSRTFSTGADKCVELANNEYLRTMAIGNNWTRIRVGILAALQPNGTNNIASCRLLLGLCSGKSNPYGAAATTNFIGARIIGKAAGDGTATYNAGGGNPYFLDTDPGFPAAVRKVGGVITTVQESVGFSAAGITTTTGALQRRSPFFVEIVKGSPNYQVRLDCPGEQNAARMQTDYTYADFRAGLEQQGNAVLQGNTLNTARTYLSIACDETAGVFDTVNLFWNKSQVLEVYALGFYKLA